MGFFGLRFKWLSGLDIKIVEEKEKCGSPEEGSSIFQMQSQKVSGKFISVLKLLKQLQ